MRYAHLERPKVASHLLTEKQITPRLVSAATHQHAKGFRDLDDVSHDLLGQRGQRGALAGTRTGLINAKAGAALVVGGLEVGAATHVQKLGILQRKRRKLWILHDQQ